MTEEERVLNSEIKDIDAITAYLRVPYNLLSKEIENDGSDFFMELEQIAGFYKIYKDGKRFITEGTNGDYTPANLSYKICSTLINKEARFLFAEPPSISINPKSNVGKLTDQSKDALTSINGLIKAILDENNFEQSLLKGAKDCFIGKRVAAIVNFNELDGVVINFIPSMNFYYETKPGNSKIITKFVGFTIIKSSIRQKDRRVFKKKFVLDDNGDVYAEDSIYDGTGSQIEVLMPLQKIKLKEIPVVVFVNDGLTGDLDGESEIDMLKDYEMWYSKLSNADIDAERKSMNPIRYTVDMETQSTKGLSSSAGAYWDLASEQNVDNPHPAIGMLESSMGYSETLKTSLDRLKSQTYEQIDMPNITLESLQGAMTSGKSLKAIYWPLIVRCKEKMKMWSPKLRQLIDIIIQGSFAYSNCIMKYTNDKILPIEYEVEVGQNLPLPEDEIEEKTMDISEVMSSVMSKKSYMQKWRGLTDDEVEEELKQMAIEREILEDSAMPNKEGNGLPYNNPNELNTYEVDDEPEDIMNGN